MERVGKVSNSAARDNPPILSENRFGRYAGIAMVIVLIAGCFVVLRPFLSAILWALILSFLPGRSSIGSNESLREEEDSLPG